MRETISYSRLILTEREITAVLRIERELAARMGLKNLAADETIQQMSEETQIDEITVQVKEKLSN
jgi:hypothetical protein